MLALAATHTAAQQPPIFRAGVRLVQTSIVVHDKDRQPVSDLTAGDFRIFEDGKEQKIEVFSMQIDRRPAGPAAPAVAMPAMPALFSNRVAQQLGGGVSVILLDRLNSSLEDQKRGRDQIVQFIAKLQPGERIALYVLESDAVTVLHDFTEDASRLVATANRYLSKTSFELSRSEEKADLFVRTGDADFDAETEAWLNSTSEMVSESFLRRRAALTGNALEQIAYHLANIPGRKNLVWISAAFPFEVMTAHGPQNMRQLVSKATRAINAADVAVYPVDIRGLIPALNPTTSTATLEKGGKPLFTTIQTTHPLQDTMRTIAEDTGGRVFFNTNAIGDSIRRAISDARVSYVIGYSSAREADGRFHKIEVKVNRGGLEVRHRKGYFALPAAPIGNARSRLAALERVLQSPIEATNIELTAEIDRRGAKPTVIVRVDPASLIWMPNKDVREAALDVLIALSTPDGKYFKIKETEVDLTADADRYKAMVEDGLTLSSEFTPRADAYRLHVVISDVASQAVGSLIIPLKK